MEGNFEFMKRLRHVKIRGFRDPLKGLLVDSGKQWTLLRHNPGDYVVDGFICVNKRHFLRYETGLDDAMADTIFFLKGESHNDYVSPDLRSYSSLFEHLAKQDGLIQVTFDRESSCLIGRIERVHEKSFRMRLVSVRGKLLESHSFRYDTVRIVAFGNDYVKSLNLFVNSPLYRNVLHQQDVEHFPEQ